MLWVPIVHICLYEPQICYQAKCPANWSCDCFWYLDVPDFKVIYEDQWLSHSANYVPACRKIPSLPSHFWGSQMALNTHPKITFTVTQRVTAVLLKIYPLNDRLQTLFPAYRPSAVLGRSCLSTILHIPHVTLSATNICVCILLKPKYTQTTEETKWASLHVVFTEYLFAWWHNRYCCCLFVARQMRLSVLYFLYSVE